MMTSEEPSKKTRADDHARSSVTELSHNVQSSGEYGAETFYTLKEYRSRLAVFKNNDTLPFYLTNVFVNDLPKADRDDLSKGLTVKSRKELDRLIEDYCS